MSNTVQMIDDQGQWACEGMGGGVYRLYAWCYGGGSPDAHLMEASRRISCVELGAKGYWTIDNLEIRHAMITTAYGYGVGNQIAGSPGHNIIQNCLVHHNGSTGIKLVRNPYSIARRNYSIFNNCGIDLSSSDYAVAEENDVAWNLEDGIRLSGPSGEGWAMGPQVRRNYIHDHIGNHHPDNMQAFRNLDGAVVEDNVLLCGGQMFMIEQARNLTLRGNYFLSSYAAGVLIGKSCQDVTLEHNTICFSQNSMTTHAGISGYQYKNNIFLKGNGGLIYGVGGDVGYTSDYNCFWKGPGYELNSVQVVVWGGQWHWTFAQYQAGSGQDAHSYYVDPLFANVPSCHFGVQEVLSATRIQLAASNVDSFEIGDHLEIDYDGTIRTVTAKGIDYLDFAPAKEEIFDRVDHMVANWKDKTDIGLDFTLLPGSPALNSADDGTNMGSHVDFHSYLKADFNSDGRRDVPDLPE